MSKRPQLQIVGGDRAGERFEVKDVLRLGRSSTNDIHLADAGLSRNHCLFEPVGDDGICVTDLSSANGTYVNGELLDDKVRTLAVGDRIEVGDSVLAVVSDESAVVEKHVDPVVVSPEPVKPAGDVDLGLGEKPADQASGGAKRRSPIANILLGVLALCVIAAIAVVLFAPGDAETSAPKKIEEHRPEAIDSLYYEKVEADSTRVFRYEMTLEGDMLHVMFDDVPEENRHVDKKARISERAMARIVEIFETRGFAELDNTYSGSSAMDENELNSWRIRVVRGGRARDILVENTIEPDAFRTVREALEAFSRNELGIWAIQYTREKLIELSEASAAIGDAKWDEREVEYGNLSAAVRAYREAVFYLDTVNPKPDGYAELKSRLSRTEEELSARYKDQRFVADKAINLGDWEAARTELKVLCELVPDKDDDRHAEANAKLVDVENRMKKAKGGR